MPTSFAPCTCYSEQMRQTMKSAVRFATSELRRWQLKSKMKSYGRTLCFMQDTTTPGSTDSSSQLSPKPRSYILRASLGVSLPCDGPQRNAQSNQWPPLRSMPSYHKLISSPRTRRRQRHASSVMADPRGTVEQTFRSCQRLQQPVE